METPISDCLIPIINEEFLDDLENMFNNDDIDYESKEYKQLSYELEVNWLRENYGENII